MVEIRWKRGRDVVEIWWICSGKNGGKVVEKVLKFRWNTRGNPPVFHENFHLESTISPRIHFVWVAGLDFSLGLQYATSTPDT